MPHLQLTQQPGLQLRQQTSLIVPAARPSQAVAARTQLHIHPAAVQRPCTPHAAALPASGACSAPSPGHNSQLSSVAEGSQQHTPAAALPTRAARARQRRAHRLRVRKAAASEPDAARTLDATIFALLLPAMLTVLLEPSMAIIDAGTYLRALLLLCFNCNHHWEVPMLQPLWAAWARCPWGRQASATWSSSSSQCCCRSCLPSPRPRWPQPGANTTKQRCAALTSTGTHAQACRADHTSWHAGVSCDSARAVGGPHQRLRDRRSLVECGTLALPCW